jgi:hypothetical protein
MLSNGESIHSGQMMNGRLYPDLHTPIVAFHNMGNLKFEEATANWGTDQPGIIMA